MCWKKSLICASLAVFVFSGGAAIAIMAAQWPTTNFNGLGVIANQWLTTDPCVPDDMVYIPDGNFVMGNHFSAEGADHELPLHDVLLDAFFMSKYEITNQQYCDYLNSAYPAQLKVVGGIVSDIGNNYPYCDTHSADTDSQIDFSDPDFSVRAKDGRDMSDDPMVEVSWYGAASYCNWRSSAEGYEACYNLSTWECDFSKQGYRLATEAEWEYAARGGLSGKRFPWADPNISHSRANYYANSGSYPYDESPTSGYHALWDGVNPDTSPVGFFDGTMKYKVDYNWPGSATSYQTTSGANGFGLYDMAGNVYEWCNDWYDSNYYDTSPYDNPQGPASGTYRVRRGGSWFRSAYICRVAHRFSGLPDRRGHYGGFHVVLDLGCKKAGDFTGDGKVDFEDYCKLAQYWLQAESSVDIAPPPSGDGRVDFKDLAILAEYWLTVVPPGQASNPNPADGATGIDINSDLSWTAGAFADSHDVYFGPTSPPPFIGNQTAITFDPCTMAPSTTYYWRVDEVNPWVTTTGTVWSFTTMGLEASNPNPADGATEVSATADLSWTADVDATSHDVYFGTNPAPGPGEFQRNQTETTFDPGPMAPSTMYYWRIDEVNAWGKTTGTVWSFTTMAPPPP